MYSAFNLWLFQHLMQQFEFVSVQRRRKKCSKTREIVVDNFFLSRVELSCNLTDFFSRQSCCRSRSRAHRQLWLNAFILFIFAVALAGLAYYTMTLQNQLAILTIHLDPGKSCKLFFQCTEVRFASFFVWWMNYFNQCSKSIGLKSGKSRLCAILVCTL